MLPILINAEDDDRNDASAILRDGNKRVVDMAVTAQDFYLSMGFQPLPLSFWTRSQFVKPEDGRETVCHATAVNFYRRHDVRSGVAFQ